MHVHKTTQNAANRSQESWQSSVKTVAQTELSSRQAAIRTASSESLCPEFLPERQAIERELSALLLPGDDGDCGSVHEAMAYATLGNGKRIRPVLSIRVAEMIQNETALSLRAAASVEIFHCASLIIDDLPCMDNESERRGRPTVHVAYGEAAAVLAAFGLVALGSRCLLDLPVAATQLPQLVDFQKRLLRTLDCA